MKSPAEGPEWRLAYVRTEDIDACWGWIAPFIDAAFKRAPSDMTTEEIRERAKTGQARVWVVHQGKPVSVFVVNEFDRIAEIFVLAGARVGEWMKVLLPDFCDMAKRAGNERLRMVGREGWLRVLSPLGFVFAGRTRGRLTMEKVL